jgi:HEAT repeat protein
MMLRMLSRTLAVAAAVGTAAVVGSAPMGSAIRAAGQNPAAAQNPAAPQAPTAADVTAAIDKLGSFDYATRTNAARLIRRAAPEVAVPPLVKAARAHTDEYARFRALTLLAGFGGQPARDVMREVQSDRNDRLRTVAFAWFEHNPDPEMLPVLLDRLTKERSEFVRPALTRALAAHGADPRVRTTLVPLIARGEDFFRGALIEAIGDYDGKYAVAEIAEVAKLDGPLQDDAITALGRIGDSSQAPLLASLQKTAPRSVQPTISAALCLMDLNCAGQEEFLKKTLAVAVKDSSYQDVLRGAAHAFGVLAARGRPGALGVLFDAGIPAADPARAPIALALGMAVLRNPAGVLPALESRKDRDAALSLLQEAFDMLSEDYEEERFFVEIRKAYWSAAAGSPRRQVAEALIQKLEF